MALIQIYILFGLNCPVQIWSIALHDLVRCGKIADSNTAAAATATTTTTTYRRSGGGGEYDDDDDDDDYDDYDRGAHCMTQEVVEMHKDGQRRANVNIFFLKLLRFFSTVLHRITVNRSTILEACALAHEPHEPHYCT